MADDVALPPDLARYMRGLETRISLLERNNPLKRASAHDGTVTRVQAGEFTNPSSGLEDFGLVVRNDAGRIVFMVGNEGPLFPLPILGGVQKVSDYEAVSSGSFDTQYALSMIATGHPILRIAMAVTVDAATTGEVRLRATHSSTEDSASLALPALTDRTLQVRLNLNSLSGYDDGWSGGTGDDLDSVVFSIQARRLSGAGNVNIYHPSAVFLSTSDISAESYDLNDTSVLSLT